MALRDTYIIERDERDMGGALTLIAVYEDYQTAKEVWDKIESPINENVTLWLLRRIGGSEDIGKSIVIDCKVK